MIEHAKTFNIIVGLSSNLNYLPEEKAKYLVESGIDIIVISLDGASGESYSKYRAGGDFDTVLRNVNTLLSLKKSNRPFPLLIWQFLVNSYNENEIDAARNMAEKLGLQFFASPIRTHMGKELLYPLHERVKAVKEWLPKNPAYNRYAYKITPKTKTRQKTCKWLWNTAVANWDGSLSPCCGVFEKAWDFTVYTYRAGGRKSFHHAWNSERYQLARKMIHTYEKNPRNLKPLFQETEQQQLICTKCIRYGFLEE
jgi:MoaA/NifB/PqqE/SkfB family radical SAM enzyme